MTTDYRALCAELLDELSGYASANPHHDSDALVARARAALAEPVADGPAVPESREPASVTGEPTDEELLELMPETMRDEFSYAAKACSNATGGQVKPGIFRVCLNSAALEYARAVLARWGRPAPVPAEGEVAWLIEFLRNFGDELMNEHGGVAEHNLLTRAADLLEQRHPAPPAAEEVGYAKDVRRMCDIILGNTFGNEELDSLALLVGHHADVLNAAPPAEGEVADEARYLAKELRDQADDLSPSLELFGLIHRAADLLSQRHPTPVPMSVEREGAND